MVSHNCTAAISAISRVPGGSNGLHSFIRLSMKSRAIISTEVIRKFILYKHDPNTRITCTRTPGRFIKSVRRRRYAYPSCAISRNNVMSRRDHRKSSKAPTTLTVFSTPNGLESNSSSFITATSRAGPPPSPGVPYSRPASAPTCEWQRQNPACAPQLVPPRPGR